MEAVKKFQQINLEQITASETNPRTRFEKKAIASLAETIKSVGLLQPITVREVKGNGKPSYEIIMGERRYRACKLLGLSTITASVIDSDDSDIEEKQLIENIEREDLHPLEEAEAFKKIIDSKELSVDDLALKIGKSKAYIYQRLRLLALSGQVKKIFSKGEISATVALLFARIPHKELQNQALTELLDYEEELTYRIVFDFIERNYMTRLKDAPFNIKDTELVPKAGACTDCPKRTGNQKELFIDIEKEDTCTDPICFKKKKEAGWLLRATKAKEQGQIVIEGKEADKICPYGYVSSSSGYVDLSGVCHKDKKRRTWKQMVKRHLPKITLVRNSNEKVVELVRQTELREALKKCGFKVQKEEKNTTKSAGSGTDRKTIRVKREACSLATTSLVKKMEGYSYQKLMKLVVPFVLRGQGYHALREIVTRRNLTDSKNSEYQTTLEKEMKGLSENAQKGFLIELLISGDKWSTYCGYSENFKEACKDAGVDLKLAEKEAQIALEAKKKNRGSRRKR